MQKPICINICDAILIDTDSLAKQFVSDLNDIEHDYNAFHIEKIQTFHPFFSKLFQNLDTTIDINNISLKNRYQFTGMDIVLDTETNTTILNKRVFIKFAPLLDPIRYMIGKYDISDDALRTLPSNMENNAFSKLKSIYNASYVDCFFSFLSSQSFHKHGVQNAVDFYGSFLGIQEKYKMNITDDLEYLNGSPFFLSNIGKHFYITDNIDNPFIKQGSRNNKQRIEITSTETDENNLLLDFEEIDTDMEPTVSRNGVFCVDPPEHPVGILGGEPSDSEQNGGEVIYEKTSDDTSSNSDNSSNNSKVNYSSDEDDDISENGTEDDNSEDDNSEDDNSEDDDSEDDDSEDEIQTYAYINKFPVQMICMEKCDGTLDELFVKGKINAQEGASVLFQIIATLMSYQKMFHFTHNDLHTNNIMYINTDIEFLYYKIQGQVYQVPTYGRIYKIIDFGRSIYRFQEHVFCSDSFAPNGDANGQYNFEPYFDNNKPRLDPNYSFDLCRLGTSIYDFIIEDDHNVSEFDDLQQTIYRWCLDDNGKNVLYKRNGDERYPNFKLYKMIARTVHQHCPEEQLKYPIFNQFVVKDGSDKLYISQEILDIDNLPDYA